MSLQQAIHKELGVEPELKMAMPGALDVYVDGRKVFSKQAAGHMPTAAEIIPLIQAV